MVNFNKDTQLSAVDFPEKKNVWKNKNKLYYRYGEIPFSKDSTCTNPLQWLLAFGKLL